MTHSMVDAPPISSLSTGVDFDHYGQMALGRPFSNVFSEMKQNGRIFNIILYRVCHDNFLLKICVEVFLVKCPNFAV